jgi:non-heme chloroperoxidase
MRAAPLGARVLPQTHREVMVIQAPSTHSVELPNQVRIPYVDQGDADGIPLVLLHGLPLTWRSFEPVLPHLPSQIRVVAPNQRGHGDASRPEAGYGFSNLSGDLAAFLDQLGIEAAVIAGHSMGSLVAQRFAVDHPQRTHGLVLAGSGLSGQVDPEELDPQTQELWDAISQLTDPVDPAFARAYSEAFLTEGEPSASVKRLLDATLEDVGDVPARAWQEVWSGLIRDDFAAQLAESEAQALVIWGEQDPFCLRADQDALTATLAHSRLESYRGAGHVPFWDEPERFASDLTAFVQQVAR